MIPLNIGAFSDNTTSFVTRLTGRRTQDEDDSFLVSNSDGRSLWCGANGLFEINWEAEGLIGDIILVDPREMRAQRLIRLGSAHNTLLVTEQCDQLCVMCSQPPKKSHTDQFSLLTKACLLSPPNQTIGVTGGEPTLHKEALLTFAETILTARKDLNLHILSNGQHFSESDVARLRATIYQRVVWGIPLYSSTPSLHDNIVGKDGAFERLEASFAELLKAGARIELRTVLTRETLVGLSNLAQYISNHLPHIEQWSLMGLENIGFARNRWHELYVDLAENFQPLGSAMDLASLRRIPVKLFNIPLCHLPAAFRQYAVASISDWKQRFSSKCDDCTVKPNCSGFFEWHPPALIEEVFPL